jgi:hypothetical protein
VKRRYAVIAASLAVLGSFSTAIAAPQGPTTIVAIQPAQPSSGCAFFQVKGGASGAWVAIALSDAAFNSELGIIISAFYSGTPIIFDTLGTACTYPKLSYVQVGTPN